MPTDKNDKKKKNPVPLEPPPKDAANAYAEAKGEIDALAEADLVSINVDIPRAVSIALGAVGPIAEHRQRFMNELPMLPIQYVDRLKTYALAAWYAHLLALPTASPDNPVKPLIEEAGPLREGLLVAAEALAYRGVLDKERVAEIRSGQGHVDTANDLVALAMLFTQNWNKVANKTAVELAEVERASVLGPELLVALGEREVSKDKPADDPAKVRVRAFSLLWKAYDQCRRGLTFLLWGERDVSEIAPSFFSGRQAPRKATAGGETPAPVPGPEGPNG